MVPSNFVKIIDSPVKEGEENGKSENLTEVKFTINLKLYDSDYTLIMIISIDLYRTKSIIAFHNQTLMLHSKIEYTYAANKYCTVIAVKLYSVRFLI